jgi:hypothetical protein
MPFNVPFVFGLSPQHIPAISDQSLLWSQPLPVHRHAFSQTGRSDGMGPHLTYGDYFSAARSFLSQDDAALVRQAVGRYTGRRVALEDLDRVAIFLVKHGAFYHPAYVEVSASDRRLPFVLNVAASSQGRHYLGLEYQSLARLNAELPQPFWPQVYGHGCGVCHNGRQLPMFLGQWLAGFYEFHLTTSTSGDPCQVVVWDTDRSHRILTPSQVQQLARQTAFILAYAFHPLTFEAVLNWHHAAGDFVLKPAEDGLKVGLITVRHYAPMIAPTDPDLGAVLDGVLRYLVAVSMRLRLDRLDGTGPMACYADEVVPAICRGFLEGLNHGCAARGLPDDLATAIRRFLCLHTEKELMPTACAVIASYPDHSDEWLLLQKMCQSHVAALAAALTNEAGRPQHAEDQTRPSPI